MYSNVNHSPPSSYYEPPDTGELDDYLYNHENEIKEFALDQDMTVEAATEYYIDRFEATH